MAGAKYKDNKPEMEKKRRSRINESLSCLKLLVLGEVRRKNTRISKLDKADILEMAVEYVQRMHIPSHVVATRVDKYRAGFNACAEEVRKHLAQTPDIDIDVRTRVVDHLANFVQNLQWLRRHDILPHDVASRHDVTQRNDIRSHNGFVSHNGTSRQDVIPDDVMYQRLQKDAISATNVRGGSTSEPALPNELTGHRESNIGTSRSKSEKDSRQRHLELHMHSRDYSSVKRNSSSPEERFINVMSYADSCPTFNKTQMNRTVVHPETQKDHIDNSRVYQSRVNSDSVSHGVGHMSSGGRPSNPSDKIRVENRNICLRNHETNEPWGLDANGNHNWAKVDNDHEHRLDRDTEGSKLRGHILGPGGEERQGIVGHGLEANLLDNHPVWRPW